MVDVEMLAVERAKKMQAEFEAWTIREGGVSLVPAPECTCEDGRFPATYLNASTETAWRAWANKPAKALIQSYWDRAVKAEARIAQIEAEAAMLRTAPAAVSVSHREVAEVAARLYAESDQAQSYDEHAQGKKAGIEALEQALLAVTTKPTAESLVPGAA